MLKKPTDKDLVFKPVARIPIATNSPFGSAFKQLHPMANLPGRLSYDFEYSEPNSSEIDYDYEE